MKLPFTFFCMVSICAFSSISHGVSIGPGFDLLKTRSGSLTIDSFNGQDIDEISIALKGKSVPAGSKGKADTVLKRSNVVPKSNAGKMAKMDVELVALKLQSVSPVKIKNDLFKVKVKLEKSNPSLINLPPAGKLKITSHEDKKGTDKGKGTFDISGLQALLRVTFTHIGSGAQVVERIATGPMASSNGSFQHENNAYPTIPNLPAGNMYMQPFSLVGDVLTLSSLVGAAVSLPGSMVLLGGGLLLLAFSRRRARAVAGVVPAER